MRLLLRGVPAVLAAGLAAAVLAAPAPLHLFSPEFADGGAIPVHLTCDGEDSSPELHWYGIPRGARSLALVAEDPDATEPPAPRSEWVLWVVYDIPPDSDGLGPAMTQAQLPRGAHQGVNGWKKPGWGGPCPAKGTHRYVFTLYALDVPLRDLGTPDAAALRRAMRGHVLATAKLAGSYRRGTPGSS